MYRLPKGLKCYLKQDMKLLGEFQYLDLYVSKGSAVEIVGYNENDSYEIKIANGSNAGTKFDNVSADILEVCPYSLGFLVKDIISKLKKSDDYDTLLYVSEYLLHLRDFMTDHKNMELEVERLRDEIMQINPQRR